MFTINHKLYRAAVPTLHTVCTDIRVRTFTFFKLVLVLQSLNKYIFGEAYVTVAVGTTIKCCVRNV